MKYNFYGCENAAVKPINNLYPSIKSPADLYDALSEIWCAETCAPRLRDKWTKENMTKGQCSVTAFLAQDIFGGSVYGIPMEGGNFHCYNVIGDCCFDLTSEQFGEKAKELVYENNPEQFREVHFAKEEKRIRYEMLRERLNARLTDTGKGKFTNEYRIELLDVSAYPESDVLILISEINKSFAKTDLRLEPEKQNIKFMLNQLDMVKYRSELDLIDVSAELKDAAYNIINDIGSYGLKGKKRRFVGYNAERKVANRKAKEKNRGKHYYANDNGFSKKNTELPVQFENRIICADSLEVLKQLPDNCIDIIFTSPPYNFGLEYDTHNDTANWDKYYKMLFGIFSECIRVLKYGGRFVVNVQPLYSDYIPAHHIISNFFIQKKMIWKSEILWEKNNYNCKMSSYGSWKSPSSPYMKYTWEFIEVFCKGDLKKAGKSEDADITAEEFKSWVVAKWSIAPERHMKEYGHPAMFPEGLAERVLKLFSFKGDVVLDPFNGAGTTTVVAKRTGRKYLGIDISDEYCETAEKRINNIDGGQQSFFD